MPPAIDASGLRRSCPKTPINCSRSSDVFRSSKQIGSGAFQIRFGRLPPHLTGQQALRPRGKVGLRALDALVEIELRSDQFPKEPNAIDDLRSIYFSRSRIDRAERAPDLSVRTPDRSRDVAPETIHARRWVVAKFGIRLDVIDDNEFAMVANLIADRRFDAKLAPFPEAEIDAVTNGTAQPPIAGHSGNRYKAHARDSGYSIQNFGNSADLLNSSDVGAEVSHH